MGVGWCKWASQVEHSSRGEQGCACGYAHPFVCIPQFELRFVCDMAVWRGVIAIGGVALECMQMGVGWGEWANQVEHSSRGEQGCACGNAHPFVCVPQFELRFECDMAV